MPVVVILLGAGPGAAFSDMRLVRFGAPLPISVAVAPQLGDPLRPNVLLVTVDTLRADAVGAYGNPGLRTPNMDAVAREGTRFTLDLAPVPQTNPSHASIFTGDFSKRHQVYLQMVSLMDPSVKPMAEILAEAGYAAAGHYSWISLDPPYSGLDRGFATYQRHTVDRPWPPDQKFDWYEQIMDSKADVTTDGVLTWLREGAKEPFFLWVHYNDAHWPYAPPPPFDTMFTQCQTCPDGSLETIVRIAEGYSPTPEEAAHLRGIYDGEVAYIDQQLGRLLDWLRENGLFDRTVVVLTADHGEAFGEKGLWSHQAVLYNTVVRIPLIVRYPALVPQGVVEAPASSTDVLPTLLEVLGLAPPGDIEGESLLPLIRGQESGEERAAFSQLWDGAKAAIIYRRMKLIKDRATGSLELYDLARDPGEETNLAEAEHDIARDLEQRLDVWFQGHGFAP